MKDEVISLLVLLRFATKSKGGDDLAACTPPLRYEVQGWRAIPMQQNKGLQVAAL